MNLIYDFLFIVGMLFSSIYIYILLQSKDVNLSKQILSTFFGIIIFVLLESYGYIHQIKGLKYTSFVIIYGSKLLIGPLIIAYIQSIFLDNNTVIKKNRFSVIPYILFTFFISLPYAIANLSDGLFTNHTYLLSNYSQPIRISLDIVLLFFVFRGFKQFKKYKRILKCNYSNVEENNFVWVRYLLVSIFIIISLDVLIALSQLLFNAFPIRSQNIIMSLVALCIIIGAYYGINQSQVLVPYFLLEKEQTSNTKTLVIPNKQIEEFKKLESSLKQLIHEQKPYLDEALTLSKLATLLETKDKKLSKLLNQHIDSSFYNYINNFRLEEFKKRLQSDSFDDITIEGIAYECGFKSKASFYRLFKKKTGVSPSEYKKSLK